MDLSKIFIYCNLQNRKKFHLYPKKEITTVVVIS